MQYWNDSLALAGLLQGILLSVLLWRRGERILAAFAFVFAWGLIEHLIVPYLTVSYWQLLADIVGGGNWLYGPLLYLYIRQLNTYPVSKALLFKHSSVFGLYTCLVLLSSLLTPTAPTIDHNSELIPVLLIIALVIHLLTYGIISLRLLRKHPLSSLLQRLLLQTLCFILLLGSAGLLLSLFGVTWVHWLQEGIQVAAIVVVYWLSYWTLASYHSSTQEPATPYQSSPLTAAQQQAYALAIEQYLKQEKAYLNPALSIDTLAQHLDINRYYLSQTINAQFNMRFPELVHQYRVQHAKTILSDPKQTDLTILAVAFAAGFNAKTTFNTVFKKYTGITPTQYKKQARQPPTAHS